MLYPRLRVRQEKKQLCRSGLGAAVGSRDPCGCAGAREVSGPAVTDVMQRRKQNKGINSESEIGGEKSTSESGSDGEDRLVGWGDGPSVRGRQGTGPVGRTKGDKKRVKLDV